ncbi:hypothetical protein [Duncaniella dubosii]|jgi:hypothetical protein|uniref:hypothetical protein n=5 Tax=Bacteroidales TaxID=171549 RepID=UPI0025B001D7|nr:hypothetical protein [uncultured Duncaniella sp.]
MKISKKHIIIYSILVAAIITAIVLLYGYEHCKEKAELVSIISTSNCVTASHYNKDVISRCTSMTIENISESDAYFWIGREPRRELAETDLAHKYFVEHPSSYPISFKEIISGDRSCEQEVGYTFIKHLEPNTSFTIVIPDDGISSEFYTKRLVIASAETVHETLGQGVPQKYLYDGDLIVLTKPEL